jgi:hypothetical protein
MFAISLQAVSLSSVKKIPLLLNKKLMHIEYQRTVKVEPLNFTENFCRPSQVRKK